MTLLSGKPIAERLLAESKERIAQAHITPGLAVVLVGDDAASHLYVGLKEKAAKEIGIHFEKKVFPATVPIHDLFACLADLNERSDIHGIIVQLPLPPGFPTDEIIAHIAPEKDTDGFHQETLRRFLLGDFSACPVFPRAIVELLRATKLSFHGERGVVVVNSELLGKVIAQALALEGLKSSYVLSSASSAQLEEKVRGARVVVTACGLPGLITSEMITPEMVIIDGGIGHHEEKVVGDVAEQGVRDKVTFLSLVPGGVGPVTVATLLARVTDAALQK